MKIAIFDHVHKFTKDLIEHWEKSGHEVKKDRYLDPKLVNWADTTFFEFCDISIQRGSHKEDVIWNGTQPLDKNIIVRLHDIDAWVGQHKGVYWPWVNHLVFVADHIEEKVKQEITFPDTLKIHNIKHGINLERYTFRDRGKPTERGNKIAWVAPIVHHKGLELALQVLAAVPGHELHVLVTSNELGSWQKAYIDSFIKRNNLKVYYYNRVDDVNQFLEDKHFLLLTSFKEAFSFVSGEAMAKGIKPIIHHFWGAETVWPKEYLWNTVEEAKQKILEFKYDSVEYRNFIQANYSLSRMLEEYDKILWKK
jgi:glycosyltransferase involved in cell wall biosynthesis